ncbi:MAG: ABC transporter permease [Filifactoraceae bacterium]
MLLGENLKLALTSIKSNRMRSFLTMLGIIIGISSVIAITTIGNSMQGALNKQFEGFGKDRMVIYQNYEVETTFSEGDLFNMDDISRLKNKFENEILYIAPSVSSKAHIRGLRKSLDINLTGIGQNAELILQVEMLKGRLISESDLLGRKSNIVINDKTAERVFGTTDVIGKRISLAGVGGNDLDMNVVGVYKLPEDNMFMGISTGSDYSGYIPYTLYGNELKAMGMLDFYTKPNLNIQKVGQKITDFITKSKGREPGFYKFDSTELQKGQINKVLDTLSLAIACIAGIALLVGGIGIMNIMLVSVTERTREIGIRKSLGAKTKDILQQFLIESMLLSIIGGMIGVTFGLSLAFVGGKIAKVDLVISPGVILFAVIFSAAVGIFFGIYPAKKAAKLDPIEALRYE